MPVIIQPSRARQLHWLGAFALGCGICASDPVSAYQVSPMIYELAPAGAKAATTLTVNNTDAKPITIEMTVERREVNESGQETRTPADDDFVLFPPQAVVPAGKQQAVRVQYIGAPNLAQSATYVVTVHQVPVKMPADGAPGVQIVFNFGTVANIVPNGARADVQTVSLQPSAAGYQLRLHNAGNKVANIATGQVVLSGGGQKVVIAKDAWQKLLGSSWLLPGHDRVIAIPGQLARPGAVSARFDLAASGLAG